MNKTDYIQRRDNLARKAARLVGSGYKLGQLPSEMREAYYLHSIENKYKRDIKRYRENLKEHKKWIKKEEPRIKRLIKYFINWFDLIKEYNVTRGKLDEKGKKAAEPDIDQAV